MSDKLSELGLIANVRRERRLGQFILKMARLNAEKFVQMVRDHVTDSFAYKLIVDPWTPAKCKKCGQTIGCEKNFMKYCGSCVPKAVLNLRRSRSANQSYNPVRKAKRAAAAGRATDADVKTILEHEASMKNRKEAAENRKTEAFARAAANTKRVQRSWPNRDHMAVLLEMMSLSDMAKMIGVSAACVSQKCRRLGLKAKPPEYWTQRKRLIR